MSGNAFFRGLAIDSSDNIYVGGAIGNSPQYAWVAKGDTTGDFTAARLHTESPASGANYYIEQLELFPSGGGLLAALNLYSTANNERSAAIDIDTSTLVFSDLDSSVSADRLRGWRNSNYRSGNPAIVEPDGTDVWLIYSGWTGSNVGNYLLNHSGSYGPNPAYNENFTVYSTQYPRSAVRDGTNIFVGCTAGIDPGNGGYGNMIVKLRSTDGAGLARGLSYSSNGGNYGPQQTQISHGNGGMVQDSTYLYTVGHHSLNGSSYPQIDNMHVMKIRKSDLALQWQKKIGEYRGGVYQYLQGEAIAVDDNGNVYAASDNNGYIGQRPKIAKYNSSGTLQWFIEFGQTNGSNETSIYAMKVHNDFLYMAGRTYDTTAGNYNGMIVKFPLDGTSGTFGNYIITQLTSSDYVELTNYSSYTTSSGSYGSATPSASAADISQANNAFNAENFTSL